MVITTHPNGHTMLSHFVPSGQRIGTTEYLWASGILEEVLIPWLEQHYNLEAGRYGNGAGLRPSSYSSAGAKSPEAEDPQVRAQEEMAPSSPDLNPSGYWLWSVMEKARGVTTLKKVVRNAGQGRFAGGGAALFKGAPMPKCTILKMRHSTGAR